MGKPRVTDQTDRRQLDLAALDHDFAAALPLSSPAPIPDGRYHIRVEHVALTTARTSAHPILKWRLRVVGPVAVGRVLWKNHVLSTANNLRWLKHELHLCGLALERLSDLPNHLDELFGLELEVTKRTRGDWENIHFNRLLALPLRRRPTPL
jgi:hypothetical protein